MTSSLAMRLAAAIRDVPDFPQPGILFKDITPILANPPLLAEVVRDMAAPFRDAGITHVVGVESRGFLFGVPLALTLGVPFAPARKPGKLPWRVEREAYTLEYRSDVLEMHTDALKLGDEGSAPPRVLIVDDLLATGGTALAAARLVERLGGEVVAISVVVELGFLGGRTLLDGRAVHTLVAY